MVIQWWQTRDATSWKEKKWPSVFKKGNELFYMWRKGLRVVKVESVLCLLSWTRWMSFPASCNARTSRVRSSCWCSFALLQVLSLRGFAQLSTSNNWFFINYLFGFKCNLRHIQMQKDPPISACSDGQWFIQTLNRTKYLFGNKYYVQTSVWTNYLFKNEIFI